MLTMKSTSGGSRFFLPLLIASLVAILLGAGAVHAQPGTQDANLLVNPGFEPFTTPEGQFDYPLFVTPEGGGHVAEGWTPWWYWHLDEDIFKNYIVPEFDIAPVNRDPFRVHSGNAAQQIFRPSAMWKAGVYQVVTVPHHAKLAFSIYGHAWAGFCKPVEGGIDCGDNHDSYYGDGANPAIMRVGIDPYGGSDWSSPNIVWSQDYNIHDHYEQLVVSAQAQGSRVTVFTYTTFVFPAVINNVYWDDAALVLTTGATPTAPSDDLAGQQVEATTTVNVRSGPGTSYTVIGQIKPGTLYTILGQSGYWFNIDYNGASGWVYTPLVVVQ